MTATAARAARSTSGLLQPYAETAAALREAFEILMRIRLDNHAAQIEAGAEPTNVVAPASLPPLTRAQLREAFGAIAHAQKLLAVYVPLGL